MLCCDYAMPDMSLKTHLCRPRKAAAHTGGCRAPHPGSTCLPHTHSLSAGPQEPHSRRCQQCACSIREQMTSALPLACTAQYVHTRQQHMVPSHLQVHMLASAGTAQQYTQATGCTTGHRQLFKEHTATDILWCAMHALPEALSRLEVCAQAKICCLDHGIIGRGGQQEVLRLDVPAVQGPRMTRGPALADIRQPVEQTSRRVQAGR